MSLTTTTSHNLGHGEPPPQVTIHRFPSAPPMATVALDDHAITVTGRRPADLRVVADAFTDAAKRLSDELDRHAAAQVSGGRVAS